MHSSKQNIVLWKPNPSTKHFQVYYLSHLTSVKMWVSLSIIYNEETGPEGLMGWPDVILGLLMLDPGHLTLPILPPSVAARSPIKRMFLSTQKGAGILLSFWTLENYISGSGKTITLFFFFLRRGWLESEVAVFLLVFVRFLACLSLEGNNKQLNEMKPLLGAVSIRHIICNLP